MQDLNTLIVIDLDGLRVLGLLCEPEGPDAEVALVSGSAVIA